MKRRLLILTVWLLAFISLTSAAAGYAESKNHTGSSFSSTLHVEMEGNDANLYLYPGAFLKQGFTMTVDNGGGNCWLFVRLDTSENFDSYLSYQVEEGWAELPGEDNVYYRLVTGNENHSTFDILVGDSIWVRDTLTMADLERMASTEGYPEIHCHAVAIIAETLSPEKAWEIAADD